MLVHHRVTPSIKFTSTHLYTWVQRPTVTVKGLAQEHNTVEHANDEATTIATGWSLTELVIGKDKTSGTIK